MLSLWRLVSALGRSRADFRRFLIDFWPIKKSWFFDIAPKRQRKQTQSTTWRRGLENGAKNMICGFVFCIDFSTFS
jgi:hypothetical protein